jgi:hypothetical protein
VKLALACVLSASLLISGCFGDEKKASRGPHVPAAEQAALPPQYVLPTELCTDIPTGVTRGEARQQLLTLRLALKRHPNAAVTVTDDLSDTKPGEPTTDRRETTVRQLAISQLQQLGGLADEDQPVDGTRAQRCKARLRNDLSRLIRAGRLINEQAGTYRSVGLNDNLETLQRKLLFVARSPSDLAFLRNFLSDIHPAPRSRAEGTGWIAKREVYFGLQGRPRLRADRPRRGHSDPARRGNRGLP